MPLFTTRSTRRLCTSAGVKAVEAGPGVAVTEVVPEHADATVTPLLDLDVTSTPDQDTDPDRFNRLVGHLQRLGGEAAWFVAAAALLRLTDVYDVPPGAHPTPAEAASGADSDPNPGSPAPRLRPGTNGYPANAINPSTGPAPAGM